MVVSENAKQTNDTVEQKTKEPQFTKEQLVKSRKYVARRDALNALLRNDEKYSLKQVDRLLKKFEKGGQK